MIKNLSKKIKICIFGDSVPYGMWDIKKGGWVNRLKEFLEQIKNRDYLIFNCSIPGDTSKELVNRFKIETKVWSPNLLIFAIGINDSQFYIKENKFKISQKEFEKNLKKLVSEARCFTCEILFVGPNPVDEKLTVPLPRDKNRMLKNEFIKKYNEIIKNICKNEEINFIDIFSEWIKLDYRKFLADGLHPNETGHEKIFERIKLINFY